MEIFDCECGNPDCHAEVVLRKGPVWVGDDKQSGWLHLDATDMEGKMVELMLTPHTARSILWWMLKNFWR